MLARHLLALCPYEVNSFYCCPQRQHTDYRMSATSKNKCSFYDNIFQHIDVDHLLEDVVILMIGFNADC